MIQDPQGTIHPNPKWSAKSAALKLDKAMDGVGTDESAIIDILCSCNWSQRGHLKKLFKSTTKEDLLLVMREELSGNFLELALALLREPLAFHIDLVNVLLKVHIIYYQETALKYYVVFAKLLIKSGEKFACCKDQAFINAVFIIYLFCSNKRVNFEYFNYHIVFIQTFFFSFYQKIVLGREQMADSGGVHGSKDENRVGGNRRKIREP